MRWAGIFYLFPRQRKLHETVSEYLDTVKQNREVFREALTGYLRSGSSNMFCDHVAAAHRLESKADDLRRTIEQSMYSNALLPDSRGDILGLIESYDKIPGICERMLNYLHVRNLTVPTEIHEKLLQLMVSALDAADQLVCGIELFFTRPKRISECLERVDKLESRCDLLEKELTIEIFALPLDPVCQEQLARVVEDLSSIADQAEDTGTRLQIAAIKRAM